MKIQPETWDKVRRWFHYPSLKEPSIEPQLEGGAHFDFATGDIRVGESFIRDVVSKSGTTEKECLEGLLTHEVGHYMIFPRTLSNIILSGKMLDDFFDNYQNFIFQTYADMANDTSSVLDSNKRESILRMRTASQETLPDELNQNVRELMLAYLNRQAGNDYQLKPELDNYLERMLQIEFLSPETNRPPKDAQKLRLSLFQWGDVINDMMNNYQGEPKTGDSNGNPNDMDLDEIVRKSSRGSVRKALREISGDISRGEYKKIKDWLKEKVDDLPEAVLDKPYVTIGTANSGEIKIEPEVVNYYKELSKQYPLIVHKKPVDTKKTRKSFEETEKWQVGKEPLLAMPNLSGSLFLPGITRKVKIKERKIRTTDYDIPHLLIAMDSSGSMPDPSDTKSHAVLAGFCAARSYHIHDSAVGVINFGGSSFYLPYTRDLDDALSGIAAYQGGGTTIDLEMLKKMLRPEEYKLYEENPEAHIRRIPKQAIKKEIDLSFSSFEKALESGSVDLLMFTDGGISNLEDVVEFFDETHSLNRGTIVLTGNYSQVVPETGKNINIYRIDNEEDIPNIVLNDVRGSMNYHATKYDG
jgi:hypothetical protein